MVTETDTVPSVHSVDTLSKGLVHVLSKGGAEQLEISSQPTERSALGHVRIVLKTLRFQAGDGSSPGPEMTDVASLPSL